MSAARTTIPCQLICWLLLLSGCSESPDAVGKKESQRALFPASFLLGEGSLESPVDTSAFHPSIRAIPSNHFQGTLELQLAPGQGRLLRLVDRFDLLANDGLQIAELPPFHFDFIQDGSDLIPLQRGTQVSTHPYWEFILEPGKAWDEAGDRGYSRASIPFSLQQRNANCTHNDGKRSQYFV